MATVEISGLDVELSEQRKGDADGSLLGFVEYLCHQGRLVDAALRIKGDKPIGLSEWVKAEYELFTTRKDFFQSQSTPQCSGGVCTTIFPSSHIVEYSEIE